jgi:cell division protein FtsL
MFEAMTLAMKMSEVLKTVDKNIQYLAVQIDASNKRIDELEKQVALLTNRVDCLYEEP